MTTIQLNTVKVLFLLICLVTSLSGLPNATNLEVDEDESGGNPNRTDFSEGQDDEVDIDQAEYEEIRDRAKKSYDVAHAYSIMQFSYDEKSPLGPQNWDNTSIVKDATRGTTLLSRNRCELNWVTPIDIDTSSVIAPDLNTIVDDDDEGGGTQRSVTLTLLHPDISSLQWELGHPTDAYHGLEVRVPQLGLLSLNDRFDYIGQGVDIGWTGVNEFTNYDLNYAAFFYCDPSKASEGRSMHQIDGQKFPLEIDFIFFSQPPKIGIDNFICDDQADPVCKTVAVMLVVLAEFSDQDNPKLGPLLKAAARYNGPSFSHGDGDEHFKTLIPTPWSPTWLIPESSDYYYYDEGSFPVPPCWPIARIYIVTERITISHRQLSTLSSVRTEREPTSGYKMPCTFSLLRQRTGDDKQAVKFNEANYVFKAKDGRPLTDEEKQAAMEDEKKEKDESKGEDSGCGGRIMDKCDRLIKVVVAVTVMMMIR